MEKYFGELPKNIVSVTALYAILNLIPFMSEQILFSHFYFYAYKISRISIKRRDLWNYYFFSVKSYSLYIERNLSQVRLILVLLGTVNSDGGVLDLNLSPISKMTRVLFSIPLWHLSSWILILFLPMALSQLSFPYLLWRSENLPEQEKLLSTSWLVVTALLFWVFIIIWVVLSFLCVVSMYFTLQQLVNVTIPYSTLYRLICFVTLLQLFLSYFCGFLSVLIVPFLFFLFFCWFFL